MKKLLSLLAISTLGISASMAVISCAPKSHNSDDGGNNQEKSDLSEITSNEIGISINSIEDLNIENLNSSIFNLLQENMFIRNESKISDFVFSYNENSILLSASNDNQYYTGKKMLTIKFNSNLSIEDLKNMLSNLVLDDYAKDGKWFDYSTYIKKKISSLLSNEKVFDFSDDLKIIYNNSTNENGDGTHAICNISPKDEMLFKGTDNVFKDFETRKTTLSELQSKLGTNIEITTQSSDDESIIEAINNKIADDKLKLSTEFISIIRTTKNEQENSNDDLTISCELKLNLDKSSLIIPTGFFEGDKTTLKFNLITKDTRKNLSDLFSTFSSKEIVNVPAEFSAGTTKNQWFISQIEQQILSWKNDDINDEVDFDQTTLKFDENNKKITATFFAKSTSKNYHGSCDLNFNYDKNNINEKITSTLNNFVNSDEVKNLSIDKNVFAQLLFEKIQSEFSKELTSITMKETENNQLELGVNYSENYIGLDSFLTSIPDFKTTTSYDYTDNDNKNATTSILKTNKTKDSDIQEFNKVSDITKAFVMSKSENLATNEYDIISENGGSKDYSPNMYDVYKSKTSSTSSNDIDAKMANNYQNGLKQNIEDDQTINKKYFINQNSDNSNLLNTLLPNSENGLEDDAFSLTKPGSSSDSININQITEESNDQSNISKFDGIKKFLAAALEDNDESESQSISDFFNIISNLIGMRNSQYASSEDLSAFVQDAGQLRNLFFGAQDGGNYLSNADDINGEGVGQLSALIEQFWAYYINNKDEIISSGMLTEEEFEAIFGTETNSDNGLISSFKQHYMNHFKDISEGGNFDYSKSDSWGETTIYPGFFGFGEVKEKDAKVREDKSKGESTTKDGHTLDFKPSTYDNDFANWAGTFASMHDNSTKEFNESYYVKEGKYNDDPNEISNEKFTNASKATQTDNPIENNYFFKANAKASNSLFGKLINQIGSLKFHSATYGLYPLMRMSSADNTDDEFDILNADGTKQKVYQKFVDNITDSGKILLSSKPDWTVDNKKGDATTEKQANDISNYNKDLSIDFGEYNKRNFLALDNDVQEVFRTTSTIYNLLETKTKQVNVKKDYQIEASDWVFENNKSISSALSIIGSFIGIDLNKETAMPIVVKFIDGLIGFNQTKFDDAISNEQNIDDMSKLFETYDANSIIKKMAHLTHDQDVITYNNKKTIAWFDDNYTIDSDKWEEITIGSFGNSDATKNNTVDATKLWTNDTNYQHEFYSVLGYDDNSKTFDENGFIKTFINPFAKQDIIKDLLNMENAGFIGETFWKPMLDPEKWKVTNLAVDDNSIEFNIEYLGKGNQQISEFKSNNFSKTLNEVNDSLKDQQFKTNFIGNGDVNLLTDVDHIYHIKWVKIGSVYKLETIDNSLNITKDENGELIYQRMSDFY